MKITHGKKTVTWVLAAALLFASFFPDNSLSKVNAATGGNSIESEFDMLSDKFGSKMNAQMECYLSGGVSDRAEVETDLTFAGYKSRITFHMGTGYEFPLKKDDDEAKAQVGRWVNQAISNYPNLCTLFTYFSYTATVDAGNNHYLQDITVYSPVSAGEVTTITNSYKKALSDLIAVPKSDRTMTEEQKALYVHDQIILSTDYYALTDNILYNTPLSVLLEKRGVCQAYTYVYNHALNELGIDSLFLMSTEHAWNAVRLRGKWYYVDVTWDDPIGQSPSYIGHDYFLVTPSAFASDHTLTADYNRIYGKILNQMGSEGDLDLPESTPEPTAVVTEAPQPTPSAEASTPAPTATAPAPTATAPAPTTVPTASPTTPPSESTTTPAVTAPAKTSVKSLKNNAKGKVLVTYKAVSGASGYQISYATKKKFTNQKKVISKKKTALLSKLKKKTYYVRVRPYVLDNGTKLYGKWSAVKKIKVTKA